MRLLLLSLLLLPLAKSAAEIAIFNEVNERRVMIITGAGGEEEYTELFAEWAVNLATANEDNAAELVSITNKPEYTGARKTVELTLNKWVEKKNPN